MPVCTSFSLLYVSDYIGSSQFYIPSNRYLEEGQGYTKDINSGL